MRRARILVVVTSWLLGCGARSAIEGPSRDGDESSGQGTSTSSAAGGGTSSTTGSGGAGGTGGVDVVCEGLDWVGDPVFATLTSNGDERVNKPVLMRTASDQVGLAVALDSGSLVTIASLAIENPFTQWPPLLGESDVNYPSVGPFAFTTYEPTMMGFFAPDAADDAMALGGMVPGQNGSSYSPVPLPAQEPRFAARSGLGAYLLGIGVPTQLDLRWTDSATVGVLEALPSLGCASPALGATAPLTDANGFWVASSADQPLGDCLDPDLPGPGRFLQLHRVEDASVRAHQALRLASPPVEIDVATHGDTVYVGVQEDVYTVYTRDLDFFTAFGVPGRTSHHALGIAGDALIMVEANFGVMQSVDIALWHVRGNAASLMFPFFSDVSPSTEPALLISEDPLSVLVAFVAPDDRVVLLRADCVDSQ